jgi:hypothetical protein
MFGLRNTTGVLHDFGREFCNGFFQRKLARTLFRSRKLTDIVSLSSLFLTPHQAASSRLASLFPGTNLVHLHSLPQDTLLFGVTSS